MEKTNDNAQGKSFYERLAELQAELKAPKNKYNSFSNFYYRSCEDIYEAVKPLLIKYRMMLNISDHLEQIGDRYYIKAMACIRSTIPTVCNTDEDGTVMWEQEISVGYAREDEVKKGMDGCQITGTASSYARKYALNGLLLIDDCKDADTDEYAQQTGAGEKSTKIDKDAWLRQVEECYTVAAVKMFWKNQKAAIPADIIKEVYAACKARMNELEQEG